MVNLLLKYGAQKDIKNMLGFTPVNYLMHVPSLVTKEDLTEKIKHSSILYILSSDLAKEEAEKQFNSEQENFKHIKQSLSVQ